MDYVQYGRTALQLAASKGRVKCFGLLLARTDAGVGVTRAGRSIKDIMVQFARTTQERLQRGVSGLAAEEEDSDEGYYSAE